MAATARRKRCKYCLAFDGAEVHHAACPRGGDGSVSEVAVKLWDAGYQDGFNSDLGPDDWDFERDPRLYNHPTFRLGRNRGRVAIDNLVEQAFYDCYGLEIDADERDWDEY